MKRVFYKASLAILFLIVGSISVEAQQGVQFSQYVFNPLILNTAYAGYRGETYATVMYRDQWVGIQGAPQTTTASIEWLMPKSDDRVAWSLKMVEDQLGPQQTLSGYLGYTYRIPLDYDNTKRLCFGIGAGLNEYSLEGDVFKPVDNNDQSVPAGTVNKLTPDANFGVFYYTPHYYISAGLNNLLDGFWENSKYTWEKYTFYGMQQSFNVYAGGGLIFNLSDELKLKPSFMLKEDFEGPTGVDLTAFLQIHDIVWIGGSYRTGISAWQNNLQQNDLNEQDAWSAMIEIFPTPNLRIGYSYDITTSKLNPYQNGTHEISVGVGFPHKSRRELSPRYF